MESFFDLELSQYSQFRIHPHFIAGVDEVGRGPLAGPVVAACAFIHYQPGADKIELEEILSTLLMLGVTDSKKLSSKKREMILKDLGIDQTIVGKVTEVMKTRNVALYTSIYEVDAEQIDRINILRASLYAMRESFLSIYKFTNAHGLGSLIVDGNHAPDFEGPTSFDVNPLVKGDSKSALVALASIVAKEYRDKLMTDYAVTYPGYGLEKHAGYPTKMHKEAIKEYGVLPIHRRTFKGVKEHTGQSAR